MAYLYGAATTHQIDCGTGVGHAATWSIWARFALTQSVVNATRIIAALHDNTATANVLLYFPADGVNVFPTILFTHTAGGGSRLAQFNDSGGALFTAGSLHTLAGTYDGANLRLYIDTASTADATTAATETPDQGTQPFGIGNIVGGTASADATIYEVGWWPGTVLSGAQLAAMGAGTPPVTNPANYWPLVSDALDLFGNDPGTVTGATVVAHAGTNLYPASAPRSSAVAFTPFLAR